MEIEKLYKEFLQSDGVSTDSRKLRKNQLFFALRGEHFDGNEFIPEALEQGCRLVVSDDPARKDQRGVFYTGSVIETLQELAAHHRRLIPARVLAITGSNGKTTTKELIARVLETTYTVHVTRGNLNNHIGVPLTLLELKNEQIAVIEMGANHRKEIGLLCRIADPDLGLITNIGKAHLEGFGSLEGVRIGKGELYDYLAEKARPAFIDINDPVLAAMASERNLNTIPYSVGDGEAISGIGADEGLYVSGTIRQGEAEYDVVSSMVGTYNFRNIMAAVAVGLHMDVGIEKILAAVASYVPQNNRSQLLEGRTNKIVLDAYNANPTSMQESIRNFMRISEIPRMLILGDMLELGDRSEEEHLELIRWLKEEEAGEVFLVGENFLAIQEQAAPYRCFSNIDDCIAFLSERRPSGYHILLKGSRKISVDRATNILLDC